MTAWLSIPLRPPPSQAVKSAQARLRTFDAYLKTEGGEPDAGDAAKRVGLAKAVDDAKAAVDNAKAASKDPEDMLRAALDRATAAKRKMEAEGKKMVKCKEEELNDTYFELGEELHAALGHVAAARLEGSSDLALEADLLLEADLALEGSPPASPCCELATLAMLATGGEEASETRELVMQREARGARGARRARK